ncbi:hypothetical protein GIB67_029114 [Kingdonia uniflora]|uniref:RING-type E3 ubiquitin transferase n=1 Tax=Kingdonia uniflora TaxID=39325 RepID=A0A7J7N6S4_9MAGN|nr:hypothetical protein GIB67_029114 [Kingdonia uniflora]
MSATDLNLITSFLFVNNSITIFYFGKEGENCKFSPLYPEAHMPVRIPFQEGLGQKFCQPSGTGIDLGFFELDDLSKPSQTEDVFPLVIYVEAGLPTPSSDEPPISQPTSSQSTQAVLVKNNNGFFQAKVIRQILWVEGIRYELRDIYGISNSDETGFNDEEPEKDCVICMSEPKDTAVLPCRHMCMCSECAKELRLQTNKCPICRQPIEELIEIKDVITYKVDLHISMQSLLLHSLSLMDSNSVFTSSNYDRAFTTQNDYGNLRELE